VTSVFTEVQNGGQKQLVETKVSRTELRSPTKFSLHGATRAPCLSLIPRYLPPCPRILFETACSLLPITYPLHFIVSRELSITLNASNVQTHHALVAFGAHRHSSLTSSTFILRPSMCWILMNPAGEFTILTVLVCSLYLTLNRT
jgi:hypothetical protein